MKVNVTFANKRGVEEEINDLQQAFDCEVINKTEQRIELIINEAYISNLDFNANSPHYYSVVISHTDPNKRVGMGLPMHYILWATQII